MRISVLMTVFNQPLAIIARAIDSVCKQELTEALELIIIDDGSEQALGESIQKHLATVESKVSIHYHLQVNQGQAAALNQAVQYSTGTHIAILDADDEYNPQHIRLCLAETQAKDYVLICSEAHIIADTEEDYYVPDKYDINKRVHIKDCVIMGTLFGKKEVFETIAFEEHRALDAIFYDEACRIYPARVGKLALPTYIYYRNSPTSKTNQLKGKGAAASYTTTAE